MTDNVVFDDFIYSRYSNVRQVHQDELLMDCPKCQAVQRFCMNPVKKKYNCYRCGGGQLVTFLQEECGLSRVEAFKLLKGYEVETLDDFATQINKHLYNPQRVDLHTVTVRDGTTIQAYLRAFLPLDTSDSARLLTSPFLERRGFTAEYASRWGLLYAGQGKFAGRIIIPVWYGGRIVYFQGRSIVGNEPKYYNPSLKDSVTKDDFLFNIENAAKASLQTGVVYICEGAFNAMSIGAHAVCIFGKHLSHQQEHLIRKHIPTSVRLVFALDYGAEDKAYEGASRLSGTYSGRSCLWMDIKDDINDVFVKGGYTSVQRLLRENERHPIWVYQQALQEGRVKIRHRR